VNVPWPNERIAEFLNRLPMVFWDRCIRGEIEAEDGDTYTFCDVYGWIERSDGRRDYAKLDFVSWAELPAVSTSSAKYSEEIVRLCNGPDSPHYPCECVSDVFGAAVERTVA